MFILVLFRSRDERESISEGSESDGAVGLVARSLTVKIQFVSRWPRTLNYVSRRPCRRPCRRPRGPYFSVQRGP